MNMRKILINTRPASFHHERWKDGTPIGNGEMGAMLQGGSREELMTICRHDLWDWPIEAKLPDVHETLQASRDAIDRGDYLTARDLLSDTLRQKGYRHQIEGYGGLSDTVSGLSAPFPLAMLRISIGDSSTFYHYRRMLDTEHGIARIQYELDGAGLGLPVPRSCYVREAFISKADNVLVYRVECPDGISQVTASLELQQINHLSMYEGAPERAQRMRSGFEKTLACYIKDGLLYYGFQFNGGKQAGAVMRMIPENGELRCGEQELSAHNTSAATILVKSFAGTQEDFAKNADALRALSYSYGELKKRQAEAFSKDFNACRIHLAKDDAPGYAMTNEALIEQAYDDTMSPELAEKLWNFSRYLYISGTSPNTNPMALTGLWSCDYDLPWPQHVANENVQLIHWHINTGGLAHYGKALVNYFYKKIPEMRENAQKLFGCRGIVVSTYSSPLDGLMAPVVPVITNWISGAGWLCRHFYDYYRYTKDEALLEEQILPFMLETAAFYEDYLCRDEQGKIKIYPSVSPENTPRNFDPDLVHLMEHRMPVVKNSTMDFAILKEALITLLTLCRQRSIHAEKWETWQTILDDIPPYMINEDGAVKEWMAEELIDNYRHRHLSHLYPIFPGEEITKESDPALYKAFEKAVDLREMGAQVGWTMDHMSAIYSRFGRGEDAWNCLSLLPKSVMLPSLMLVGGDDNNMGVTLVEKWVPIQMDVNMGYLNAVQEMLFRFQNDTLYLLPACPSAIKHGEVKGFCFPGGKVDMKWDLEEKKLWAVISMDGDCAAAEDCAVAGDRSAVGNRPVTSRTTAACPATENGRPGVILPEGLDAEIQWI